MSKRKRDFRILNKSGMINFGFRARKMLNNYLEVETGQDNKGVRWMPWHQESKKDVVNCEKPRGAVSEL